jgi:hypothetical protein
LGHSRPGFARDFTCPELLKNICSRVIIPFTYGAITVSGWVFQPIQLGIIACISTLLSLYNKRKVLQHPQDIWPQSLLQHPVLRPSAAQSYRFRLFPVRSPLLRESLLFSFPPATKMFQFTGSSSSSPMCSGKGSLSLPQRGFPIRKSTGQRLLAASP